MTEERIIRERIETYKTQREELVRQANQQIAALNGAIQALEALLEPEETPEGQHGE